MTDLRNIIAQKDEEIRNITSHIEEECRLLGDSITTGVASETSVAQLDNSAKVDNSIAQVNFRSNGLAL